MKSIRISVLLAVAFAGAGWTQSAADQAFAHAVQLHQSGDLDGAIREYQAVIAASPGRFDARSNLGAVFAKLGRYSEAIEQYEEARKSAPPQVQDRLRMNIALAYYKANDLPRAASEFEALHRDQPSDVNTVLLLADCRMRSGDFPGAVKAFQDAIALHAQAPALQSFYGKALLVTGDADGAAEAFRKELAENPNDFEANLRLGQILVHRGLQEQARPLLQRALQAQPDSAEARDALAGKDPVPTADDGVRVGVDAPDVGPLGLARFRGRRPVVLVFGSYTCPQFRGSADAIKALHAKYKDRVAFQLVYIKEAHAAGQWQSSINEREHVDMQPAKDLAEKQEHASFCVRRLDLKFPSVVDGMDGKAEAAYTAWPSRMYLIGRDGKVAFNTRLGELNFQAAQFEAAIVEALKK